MPDEDEWGMGSFVWTDPEPEGPKEDPGARDWDLADASEVLQAAADAGGREAGPAQDEADLKAAFDAKQEEKAEETWLDFVRSERAKMAADRVARIAEREAAEAAESSPSQGGAPFAQDEGETDWGQVATADFESAVAAAKIGRLDALAPQFGHAELIERVARVMPVEDDGA